MRSRQITWAMLLVLAIPLLYLASIPPLAWAYERGMFPAGSLQDRALAVYVAPWSIICHSVPPSLQKRMIRYAELLYR